MVLLSNPYLIIWSLPQAQSHVAPGPTDQPHPLQPPTQPIRSSPRGLPRTLSISHGQCHCNPDEGKGGANICNTLQFSSVAQSCPTLFNPMDCSTPGFPVHHKLPELAQTQVHQVGDAIQPSHPLSSPSPPAFNLSHHQNLCQWVSSSHQVAKVLQLQLHHQSFRWIFRTDFL